MDTVKRPLFGLEAALTKLYQNHDRRSKVVLFVEDTPTPFIVVLENGNQIDNPDYAITVAKEVAGLVEQYAHGLPATTTAPTT